jgi:uncharacterized protein YdgA (DUF945 family)
MKKLILSILLVVAAAIPTVPYFISTTVEQTFRTEHEEAATDAAPSGVSIELVDYQRGYLDATATSRISILVPEGKETITLDLRHHISHLPQLDRQVIATVTTELVLTNEAAQTVAQLFKGQTPLSISTLIFLDGHQEGTFHSPSASGQISDKETVAIEWQGLEGTAWQSAARDRLTFNIFAPGITLRPVEDEPLADNGTEPVVTPASVSADDKAESIALMALRYQGDMQRAASGMWMGKGEGSIASFAINVTDKEGAPTSVLINSIGMKGEQQESNGLINAGGAFTANSINVNGFMLSNAVYDIAIENIDTTAMLAWQKTAAKMMKGEVAPDQAFAPMADYIPALFNAHPVLKINDLSVDSPMGRFAVKLDTRINGEWNEVMLENPAMIIPVIKLSLEASVPRSVVVTGLNGQAHNAILTQAAASETTITPEELESAVNQAVAQQLDGMIAQGFIKENAAQLETSIEFDAGKLTVNGMDASPMMGMMLQ